MLARCFSFLRWKPIQLVTALLILQAVGLYSFSREENPPAIPPLSSFPDNIGEWTLERDMSMDGETQAILRPDDYLLRTYENPAIKQSASLFIAYFRSQRTDRAPHSPKNCLPGSGWVPSSSEIISVAMPGQSTPVPLNSYIVAKGMEKSAVLYWYQSWNRVIASEYMARIYLVLDSIRFHRTDTALVRIVVRFSDIAGSDAKKTALQFAKNSYPYLRSYFPER